MSHDLPSRTAALRERYLHCRGDLEALAEHGAKAAPGALRALWQLWWLTLRELPALVEHSDTRGCPVGDDIQLTWRRFREQRGSVVRCLPRAALRWDASEVLAEGARLAEALDGLARRQLPLAHRSQVGDYQAGLDAQAPYPSYRCDAANRGMVRTHGNSRVERWNTGIGGLIWPSAVVDAAGNLYTGHADGEFVSLAPDGSVRWRIADPLMLYIDSTGALGRDGFLYMASTDRDAKGHQNQGRIWKIDPANGEVQWTFWGRHFEDPEASEHAHLSSFFEGNLALGWDDGRVVVFAGSDDGFLYKLDDQGHVLWEYDTDCYPSGVIWTKPLLSPDGATVWVGDLAGHLHAVDTATGQRRWRRRLGGSVVSSPAMGRFGEIFLGGFDGKVYALEPGDGSVLWTHQTLGLIYSSPAVADNGDIVIASSDGGVYRLDRFGRKRWVYRTDGPVKSSPLLDADERVYVGNASGKVYCLDADGRRLWSYATHPDRVDNDINASASMGPDGTVYFGTTPGDVWALPRDLHLSGVEDPCLCTDPSSDGLQPDLPPGGATCVFLDRGGTPRFDLRDPIPVTDNLNLAFFAVNEERDIIGAELLPGSVTVDLEPPVPCDVRVESMGRFVYVIPDDFLPADTAITMKVRGRYLAGGEERDFEATRTVWTEPRAEHPDLPVAVGDGVVIHGATICQPKEIDALGQAMMDSLNFAIAPILINREHGTLVAVCSDVTQGPEGFDYTPSSVNKMVLAGVFRDRSFRVEGSLRLVAQGANIPLRLFRLTGSVSAELDIENACSTIITGAGAVPAFADLVRVMRLADEHDDVVGFTTCSSAPLDSPALLAPEGLVVDMAREGDDVVAEVQAPGYRAEDHWVNLVIVDPAAPRVFEGVEVRVESGDNGLLRGVRATLPEQARKGGHVAILTLDLHVAGTLVF